MSSKPSLSEAELESLARRYRFSPEVSSARGRMGRQAGKETGASVEIQDFRDYVPGDDPRHIDWMAYGRTDRLMIRLYREEVSPFVDLVVDGSASMALQDGRKGTLVRELCGYLHHAARVEGTNLRLFQAGDEVQRLDEPGYLRCDAERSAIFTNPHAVVAGLRRTAVRIILSDFLDPTDPGAVLRRLSENCAQLYVLQILGPWEADPGREGPAVLEDCEVGDRVDILLDDARVKAYRRRLNALVGEIEEETLRCGGEFIQLIADKSLETMLKETFLPIGLVEPGM